ncbi:MAG: phosphoserine aminotransferase [Acidimicrobiales bacterium]|nr:MAG: phosphoserine aminotransferase [Acidimicrobiales bacterium]
MGENSSSVPDITIPKDLLPSDGRFGCGPSKVRPEAVRALAEEAPHYMGTSHRQATVRFTVGALRNGVSELLRLPDGYEVILGNGGTTVFWDALCFGLIERRSEHLSFGEFSAKFAQCAKDAPWLEDPLVVEAPYGSRPEPVEDDGVDVYALCHNETSTGVMCELRRPPSPADALVAVDATSAAGGILFDPSEVDVYYFAPQKVLASDGGLWIAAVSPAAVERIERISTSGRHIPASISLSVALENSRKDQTYNTPALATIFLAVQQVEWINSNGGLPWADARCETSSSILYRWASQRDFARPFVKDESARSKVVVTIDFEGVDASTVSAVLRRNGIVDTEAYRKLGRNQIRIATFPAIEPADVEALTACIDHVVERLA